jgi:fused signal recognition particle receptor
MAGFFKKLFNRIIGKKEEAPPEAAPPPELPAPVPEPPPPVVEAPPPPPPPEPEPEPPPPPPPEPEPVIEVPAPVEAARSAIEEVVEPAPKAKPVAKKPAKAHPAPKAKAAPERKAKPEPKPKPAPEPKPKAPAKAKAAPPPPPPAKSKAKEKVVELRAKPVAAPPPVVARAPEPPHLPPLVPPPEPVVARAPEPPPPPVVEPPPAPVIARAPEPPPPPPPVVEPPPVPVVVPKLEVPPPKAPEPPPPPPLPPPVEEAPQRKGWFARLKEGLSKSSKSITGSISAIFTKRKLDAKTLEELEDVLIQADLGLPMTERVIKAVSAGRYDKEIEPDEVKRILAEEVAKVLKPVEIPFNFGNEKPFVILVVGVNGSGKTTTIGKLGAIATSEGFSVMLAACDTFRAAAIEQLTVWGQRIGAETMSRPPGSDASGLAFDALKAAREKGTDILIVDTAGRLQNKAYLMDELDKIVRVLKKQDPTAPHAVLLVLDATVGQNAIGQAEVFSKVAGVTGIVMTKLDGTARGGILVAIAEKFALPIHAIGVGETLEDLQPFDADAFARAIAGLEEA